MQDDDETVTPTPIRTGVILQRGQTISSSDYPLENIPVVDGDLGTFSMTPGCALRCTLRCTPRCTRGCNFSEASTLTVTLDDTNGLFIHVIPSNYGWSTP
jgi:hypothetical protein